MQLASLRPLELLLCNHVISNRLHNNKSMNKIRRLIVRALVTAETQQLKGVDHLWNSSAANFLNGL